MLITQKLLIYILAISHGLTSIIFFIGGINTIRSNTNWISEIVSRLTDEMRNFEASQSHLNAKYDVIIEKVYQTNFFFF